MRNSVLITSLIPHSMLRNRFPPYTCRGGPMPDTQHWANEIDCSLLVTFSCSPGKGNTTPCRTTVGVALGNRMNKQRLLEGGFAVSRV